LLRHGRDLGDGVRVSGGSSEHIQVLVGKF